MTGIFEDGILRLEGLDDQDIADLNYILPAMQNLLAVYKAHIPQIILVQEKLIPIIQKVLAKQRSLS